VELEQGMTNLTLCLQRLFGWLVFVSFYI